MKKALSVLRVVASWTWEAMADPKNKNRIIFILFLLTAFGMIAPEPATRLRDFVLSLAL